MLRTLIFGALAGYVGKKLYDDGKLTQFKDDLVTRYNQAKADLATRREEGDGEGTLSTSTLGAGMGNAPIPPAVN